LPEQAAYETGSSMSESVWSTPQKLFDKLDAEFGFTLDVCATRDNHKCPAYFSPDKNGLNQPWHSATCWMNPPYGYGISAWMKKAWDSSLLGATVVALIPNRSNAPWWHDYVMHAHEIRFVRKKVPFVGTKKGVPFWGSCIVVFRPGGNGNAPRVSSWEQPK
jgi:phage N-6-adenine-methyltransferase